MSTSFVFSITNSIGRNPVSLKTLSFRLSGLRAELIKLLSSSVVGILICFDLCFRMFNLKSKLWKRAK